jgi:leucine-rich repeat protein SHOC2
VSLALLTLLSCTPSPRRRIQIVNVSQNVLVSPSTSAWLGKTENYLESIGFFTELTSLKLRSNRVRATHQAWLRRVWRLNSPISKTFVHAVQLTALSPALGKLCRLTRCDLSNNQITALPLEIGQLSSLSTLILSQNILESLPPTISSMPPLPSLHNSPRRLTFYN